MVALMVVEAMLAAATTWLVINAGFKIASGYFLLNDLIWILTAQSASYVAGVISWIFAERAGYQFMLRFRAREPGHGQAVRRYPSAGTGGAVSHRRNIPMFVQSDLRA
jgi:hypothetical protein